MRLGEKLIHLRQVEGQMRSLGREMTKAELVRAMRAELGLGVSHAYLSQLESGARVHLSAASRDLLARFFKIHPGYLVDDPPGFQTELTTPPLQDEDPLRGWLASRAQELREEPLVYRLLLRLSRLEDPRQVLSLVDDLLDLPPSRLESLVECSRSGVPGAAGAGQP